MLRIPLGQMLPTPAVVRLFPIVPEGEAGGVGAVWTPPGGLVLGACSDQALEMVVQTQALYRRRPRPAPWLCHLVADEGGQVVGGCGFVDRPDPANRVEIAYGVLEPFQRRGYGAAMASALVALARAADPHVCLFAHTLPERGPSPKILERAGFRCAGVVQHPEDGAVWLWEL